MENVETVNLSMINRIILFVIVTGILIPKIACASVKESIGVNIYENIQKARELYSQRSNHEKLRAAINVYKNTLKQLTAQDEYYDKKRAEIFVELSRCCFKMAEYYAESCKGKTSWFEMGEKYGRKAISLDSENVGGYYWMVQNLGQHGSLNKLYFLNKKRAFEDALKKAEELDNHNEPYDYGGIYRTLTAYYTPRLLWGDIDKALEYAKKIETSPRYLSNLSVLAELYWKIDRTKGEEYAKRIISADLSRYPETQLENTFEQKEAGEKWGKLLK